MSGTITTVDQGKKEKEADAPFVDERRWWKELSLRLYPTFTMPRQQLELLGRTVLHTSFPAHRGRRAVSDALWKKKIAAPSKNQNSIGDDKDASLGQFLDRSRQISLHTQRAAQEDEVGSERLLFAASTGVLFQALLSSFMATREGEKCVVCLPGVLMGASTAVYDVLHLHRRETSLSVVLYDVGTAPNGNALFVDVQELGQTLREFKKDYDAHQKENSSKVSTAEDQPTLTKTDDNTSSRNPGRFFQRLLGKEKKEEPKATNRATEKMGTSTFFSEFHCLFVFCDLFTKSVSNKTEVLQFLSSIQNNGQTFAVEITSPTVNIGSLMHQDDHHTGGEKKVDFTIVSLEGPSLLGGAIGVHHSHSDESLRKYLSHHMRHALAPASDMSFHLSLLKQLSLFFMTNKYDYALVLFYLTSINVSLKAATELVSQTINSVLPSKDGPAHGKENHGNALSYSISKDKMVEQLLAFFDSRLALLQSNLANQEASGTAVAQQLRHLLTFESAQQVKGLMEYLYTISTDALSSSPLLATWWKRAVAGQPPVLGSQLLLGDAPSETKKTSTEGTSDENKNGSGEQAGDATPSPSSAVVSKNASRIHVGNKYFLKQFIEAQLTQVDAEVYSYWSFVRRLPQYITVLNGDTLSGYSEPVEPFDPLASVPLFSQFLVLQAYSVNSATKITYALREKTFAATHYKPSIVHMKEDFTPVGTNNTNNAVYVFHHCRQAYQMVVGDRSDEEEGSGRLVCVPFSARMNSAGRDALLLCLSTMPREWFIGPATLENAYYKQNSSKKKSEAAQQDRQKCVETILHRIEEKYAPTTGDREGRRKAVEAKLFKEPFPVLSFLVYGLQAKSLFAPKL